MGVTLSNIHATEEYRSLILIGCRDLESNTRSRRPELKINIEHTILGEYQDRKGTSYFGNFTIFDTGYVRFFGESPEKYLPPTSAGARMNLEEWKTRLSYVQRYIISKVIKKEMNLAAFISSHVRSIEGFDNQLSYLIEYKPNTFFKWLYEYSTENSDAIIDIAAKDISRMIKKDPVKSVFMLKEFYKNPSLIKIIDNLNPKVKSTFTKDFGLIGDLATLGF